MAVYTEVSDEELEAFVAGYGIDYAEQHRVLPHIVVVD